MNIFFLELRNLRKSAIAWTLSMSCVIAFILAFFPSMQTESMKALSDAKLQGIDPVVLEVMGLNGIPDFTIITVFFGYVLQFITLAIMMYLTSHACLLLVKEEINGTIEYLYAKPVSREEIFVQKLLALLVTFLAMLIVFFLVTIAGYLTFSDFTLGAAVKEIAILYGAVGFVGLVFISISVSVSVIIKNAKNTSGASVAIVFGSFLMGALSVMVDGLDFMIYFSPMDWIKTEKLMSEGILWQEWLIGGIVIVIGLFITYNRYKKRDLLV